MVVCIYCRRNFKTEETLDSHTRLFHREGNQKMSDTSDDERENTPTSDEEVEDMEEWSGGDGSNSDDAEKEDDGDSSDQAEEGKLDEVETAAWKEVIKAALKEMKWEGDDNELLLKEPLFSQFCQELEGQVTVLLAKRNALWNGDLMDELRRTQKITEKKLKLLPIEASEVAWNLRKHKVLEFFNDNKNLLDEETDDEETE